MGYAWMKERAEDRIRIDQALSAKDVRSSAACNYESISNDAKSRG
jgi:hypothetical protein